MVADELLDSLDNKFVRLQPAAAKSKIEEDECGAAKVRITMTGCNSISIRGISSKYLPKRYVKMKTLNETITKTML